MCSQPAAPIVNAMPDAETLPGLSSHEAAARLASEGPNALASGEARTFGRIVLDVVREPMLALLLVAGAIYLALGDLHEALLLVAFACLSILITAVQETRTERAVAALDRKSVVRERVFPKV